MADIPAAVKHMALKVFERANFGGKGTKERFQEALAIAQSQCEKFGLVSGGVHTAKGRKHEQQGMEGYAKQQLFDSMYAQYVEGDTGQVLGKKPEPATNTAHTLGANRKVEP